jgi:hypothetical protein
VEHCAYLSFLSGKHTVFWDGAVLSGWRLMTFLRWTALPSSRTKNTQCFIRVEREDGGNT